MTEKIDRNFILPRCTCFLSEWEITFVLGSRIGDAQGRRVEQTSVEQGGGQIRSQIAEVDSVDGELGEQTGSRRVVGGGGVGAHGRVRAGHGVEVDAAQVVLAEEGGVVGPGLPRVRGIVAAVVVVAIIAVVRLNREQAVAVGERSRAGFFFCCRTSTITLEFSVFLCLDEMIDCERSKVNQIKSAFFCFFSENHQKKTVYSCIQYQQK